MRLPVVEFGEPAAAGFVGPPLALVGPLSWQVSGVTLPGVFAVPPFSVLGAFGYPQ